jgi:hypothetical protein
MVKAYEYTPEGLERAIDDVGRDRVFAKARELGWNSGDMPPLFVWFGIVKELRGTNERT